MSIPEKLRWAPNSEMAASIRFRIYSSLVTAESCLRMAHAFAERLQHPNDPTRAHAMQDFGFGQDATRAWRHLQRAVEKCRAEFGYDHHL